MKYKSKIMILGTSWASPFGEPYIVPRPKPQPKPQTPKK